MEWTRPTLYQDIPELMRIAIYILPLFVGACLGFWMLKKFDYEPRSELGTFGLSIISAIVGAIGIALAFYAYFYYIFGLFFGASLFKDYLFIFVLTLAMSLGLIGAYLTFKFQRRTGIILYHHRG